MLGALLIVFREVVEAGLIGDQLPHSFREGFVVGHDGSVQERVRTSPRQAARVGTAEAGR